MHGSNLSVTQDRETPDPIGIGVGDGIHLAGTSWNFDQAAASFDQHVIRSIPQLTEQREFVARLARFFLRKDALVYELGVSTGGLAEAVLRHIDERQIAYIGLDISTAMVQQAGHRLAGDARFSAEVCDILGYQFAPAALVLSYYTLQFVAVGQREASLRRIHAALTPGGALVVYEKTIAADPRVQEMMSQLYCDFKLDQGFSAEEVLNKTKSLQGLMEPCTSEWNKALLKRSGFSVVETIFRNHCFEGYLAIKGDA